MFSLLILRVVAFVSFFVTLLTLDSATENATSTLKASLKYEYPEYSCANQTVRALLSIETKNVSFTPPAISLTSVMDTSGSMHLAERLTLVKKTTNFLVDQLKTEEGRNEFGIITFSSHARVWAKLDRVTDTTADYFYKRIDKARASGKTALSEGVSRGIEQQEGGKDGNFIRCVFVLTDGKPTGEVTETADILAGIRKALKHSDRDIALYTFGVGTDLSLDLLHEIADLGGGTSYIIPDEQDIAEAFGNALGGLDSTIAIKVKLRIGGLNGAKILKVEAGGEVDSDEHGDFIVLPGNLFLEERRDIVITLQLPDSCQSGAYVSVAGSYMNTVDFESVSIPIDSSEISRSENPPIYEKGDSAVGVAILRFKIAKQMDSAAKKLAKSKDTQCTDTLREIQQMISESKFNDSTFLQGVSDDLDIFIQDLEDSDDKSGVRLQAELDGIRDAIKEQRTGLRDQRFHSVNSTKTSTEEAFEKEAIEAVTAPPPPPPAPAPVPPPVPPPVVPPAVIVPEVEPEVSEEPVESPEEELQEPAEEPVETPEVLLEEPIEPPAEPSKKLFESPELIYEQPVESPETLYEEPIEPPAEPSKKLFESPELIYEEPVESQETLYEEPIEPPSEPHKEPLESPETIEEEPVEPPELPFEEESLEVPEVSYETPVESPEGLEEEILEPLNEPYEEPVESPELFYETPTEAPEKPAPFEMDFKYSIVDDKVIGDWRELDILLTLYAPEMSETQAPLSLTTVLDRSGSMGGVPFELLKKTQKYVLDTLLHQTTTSHALGMIFFSDEAETFLPLQKIDEIDVKQAKKDLDGVEAAGTTNMEDGLLSGVMQQGSQWDCAGSRAVFLFTDGKPSTPSDISTHLKNTLHALEGEIFVYSIGLGSNVTEQLLIDISEVGGGRFYILKTARAIPRSFGDLLGGLLSLAAKNITISISPQDQVQIIKTFPKPVLENDHRFLFPNLFIQEKRDVLVKVKVPKDAEITQLLDFVISYNDAATCDLAQSEVMSVELTELIPEGQTRVVEMEVVHYLEDAELQCHAGHLPKAIDILTESIVFVSESVESMDLPYIADLLADLIRLKSKCEQADVGAGSTEEVTDDILSLKIILTTQRSTSVGHAGFHVEPYYDTTSRRQLRRNFTEEVTEEHPRPRLDAVEFQHSIPIEVVDTDVEIKIPLELTVIDEPDSSVPPVIYISYIIDARSNSTLEEISKAQDFVLETLESYKNDSLSIASSACIIVIGSDVELVLPMTQFVKIDLEDVKQTLSGLTPTGNGSFIEAIEEALEEFLPILKDKNFLLCPIISSTALDCDAKTDGDLIKDLISAFVAPVTFIPVSGSKDVIQEYFGGYPPWLKSHAMTIDSTQEPITKLKETVASIAAKRLILRFDFVEGVTPLKIDGVPIAIQNHTVVADVQYSQKLSIVMDLKLDATVDKKQILFSTNVSFFDVRSLHRWVKSPDAFIVTRVDFQYLEQRVLLRNETQDTLAKVEEALGEGDSEKCHEEVVKVLAKIARWKDTSDAAIEDIKSSLEDLLTDLQDKSKQIKDLQFDIHLLQSKLDVKSYFGNQTTAPVLEPPPETEAELSQPPDPDFEMKSGFEEANRVSNQPQNMTVNLTLTVPPSDGKTIDAHITIILDTSITANKDSNLQIIEALLNQISRRDGKRAVQILSWSEGVIPIWNTADLQSKDIDPVLEILNKVELTGDCLYYPAITRGFHYGRSSIKDSELEVIWWVLSSNYEDDENFEDLVAVVEADLKADLKAVTVFAFFTSLDQIDAKAVQEISEISGGNWFDLDLITDLDSIARKAALWIDTTLYKNVEIVVKPSHATAQMDSLLQSNSLIRFPNNLSISSIQCDQEDAKEVQVGIHIGVGWMTGTQELFRVAATYFNLRLKKTEFIPQKPFLTKRVDTEDLEKLEQLEQRLEKQLSAVPIALSQDNITEALDTIRQCQILVKNAGIGSTYLLTDIQSTLEKAEALLESSQLNGSIEEDLEEAEELIEGLMANNTIDRKLLSMPSHSKETFSDQAGQIQIPLWFTAPKGVLSVSEVLSLTVVFDAGEYKTILESIKTVLEAQKQMMIALVEALLEDYKHHIEVTFIVGRKESSTVSSPVLVTDASSVDKLNKDFDMIEASGSGLGLIKSLELGLSHQTQILNSTQRTVVVFSEASSMFSLTEDQKYEDLISQYSYQPLNPIRVMTFIVGKRAPIQQNDPISALTGGACFYFASRSEIANFANTSAFLISQSLYRSIQLTLTPVDWLKEEFKFPPWSYIKKTSKSYIASVPDIPIGGKTEFRVSLEVGEWRGHAAMFVCAVKYYRTDLKHWVQESGSIVRITRVAADYFNQSIAQDQEMTQTMIELDALADQGKYTEAKDVIVRKLAELDQSRHLDSASSLKWSGILMKRLQSLNSKVTSTKTTSTQTTSTQMASPPALEPTPTLDEFAGSLAEAIVIF